MMMIEAWWIPTIMWELSFDLSSITCKDNIYRERVEGDLWQQIDIYIWPSSSVSLSWEQKYCADGLIFLDEEYSTRVRNHWWTSLESFILLASMCRWFMKFLSKAHVGNLQNASEKRLFVTVLQPHSSHIQVTLTGMWSTYMRSGCDWGVVKWCVPSISFIHLKEFWSGP